MVAKKFNFLDEDDPLNRYDVYTVAECVPAYSENNKEKITYGVWIEEIDRPYTVDIFDLFELPKSLTKLLK